MKFYCLHPLQKIWLVNIQHGQTFLRQDKINSNKEALGITVPGQ